MTDRHAGYIVVLEKDIREDDAEETILAALRMIKGVQSVQPIVADFGAMDLAKERRDWQWRSILGRLSRSGLHPGEGLDAFLAAMPDRPL
jgi:hypothetical protein